MSAPAPVPDPDETDSPAELPEGIQAFIVQRLACYDGPSKVAEAVRETFGLTVDRRRVHYYNPDAGGEKPAERWCVLFETTRKAFLETTSQIGIAHKSYRLASLHRMAEAAERTRNYALAAQLLKQAAEEMGEVYTNHRTMKVDGQVQGGVLAVPMPMTPAAWAEAAAAQQASLPGSEQGSVIH